MKEPMPSIELDELSIEELKQMSHEELMNMPGEKLFWKCCIDDCNSFSYVMDFGVAPWYYWIRDKRWIHWQGILRCCGKHFKLYKQYLTAGQYIPERDILYSKPTNNKKEIFSFVAHRDGQPEEWK